MVHQSTFYFIALFIVLTKPRGYAVQHIPVPVPSQDKLGGLQQEGIRHKNGGLMEVDC